MKRILALILCAAVLFSLSACVGTAEAENAKTVVTTFYPIYIFTENLLNGIEGIKTVNMTEGGGGCLHDYRLMPADMRLIANAQALVTNGAGMEGFTDKVAENEPNLPIIDSSAGIELLCTEEHEKHEEEHGHHHHHNENSHIWLSVPNAQKQVANIAAGLTAVFPEHADKIKQNENDYLVRLRALDEELRAGFAECFGAQFISFHKAYDYLAEEYSLIFAASIESDENSEPGTKRLAELTRLIQKENISAMFIEPDYAGSSAHILAAETSAKVYTLNPVTSGDGSLTSYEDIMRENLKIIRKAANADES